MANPENDTQDPASAAEAAQPAGVEPADSETAAAAVEAVAALVEEESPAERAERLESELAALRDRLLRKQAEFDNYRKRVERERAEFAARAAADLIRELLSVIDNLERAAAAPDTGSEARLREGLSIIQRQFQEILKRTGLREVEAIGLSFDPHLHEAVDHEETSEHEEGEVVALLQKGYFLKDRLLRPALVKVAKRPPLDARPEPPAETGS